MELGESAYGHDLEEHEWEVISNLKKEADKEIRHVLAEIRSCFGGKPIDKTNGEINGGMEMRGFGTSNSNFDSIFTANQENVKRF